MRQLSVAQFLRVKASSSYTDDGSFLVDFFSKRKAYNVVRTDKDGVDNKAVHKNISFTDASFVSETELASLYYLGGYVARRITKNNVTSESCYGAITSNAVSNEQHTSLLKPKSCKDGCLTAPYRNISDLIVKAE